MTLLPKHPSYGGTLAEWVAYRQALLDFVGDEPIRDDMIAMADSYIAIIRAEASDQAA